MMIMIIIIINIIIIIIIIIRNFRKFVSDRDSVEPLQRDGNALKQGRSLAVVVADGCEAALLLFVFFRPPAQSL